MFSIWPKQPTGPIHFCFQSIKFTFLYLIPVVSAGFFVHSLWQRRKPPTKYVWHPITMKWQQFLIGCCHFRLVTRHWPSIAVIDYYFAVTGCHFVGCLLFRACGRGTSDRYAPVGAIPPTSWAPLHDATGGYAVRSLLPIRLHCPLLNFY